MRATFVGLLVFIAITAATWAVVTFGWLAYAEYFDVLDRDGGHVMAIAFQFAPVVALVVGLLGAIWAGLRVRRRSAR